MNANIQALSNEELEAISGGVTAGEVVKKVAKVTWRIVEVAGVFGGLVFLSIFGKGIYDGFKKGIYDGFNKNKS